ncbi:uncharacterized protein VICG_01321 [Vittaforma corneae ATCC 50505]|uniref:t-SNARE coiled-coil homology domain-containing protein n=1 Tax=Vittaforma corneae (strain ATCC 50505) TaxID=993615 RepID=L2GLD2_VITCO|nr:uncharacterized protein VICG_01321 [Vittaforma corneae ATCC 50505]ELA41688.1 hypothetical protein VICG_01321 [Vittaforma corneae ATCC 50505]
MHLPCPWIEQQNSSHLLKKPRIENNLASKQKFYEEIYSTIQDIYSRAARSTSYKTLLVLDKELNELVLKNTTLFDSLKITGTEDLQMHFDGIKLIISKKIAETSKYLASRKANSASLEIELEPQRPVSFKKVVENQILEQESRSIVEAMQYEATRQRLLKIEAVQKAIHENLMLQDERIDSICTCQSSTDELYSKLNSEISIANGSFFKRAAFTIILCLTFVLIFVHIFYRCTTPQLV